MTIIVNGEEHVIPPRTTVRDLIESLGLPTRGIAIALDRVVVPRSLWDSEVVAAGAELDIVTAMQGG